MSEFECVELGSDQNVSIVKFKDSKLMDPARIEQLGSELMRIVSTDQPDDVVINFENVRFFSSAAVGKLLTAEKHIRARGGQLRLSNLAPEVRDLFSLTHLESVFTIVDEQSAAVESISQLRNR